MWRAGRAVREDASDCTLVIIDGRVRLVKKPKEPQK
jgi:hypothetical protein